MKRTLLFVVCTCAVLATAAVAGGYFTSGGGGGAGSANPTGTIGLSAVNGTATTFMTSDSAPALSQAITPTWTGLHTHSGGLAFGSQTVAFGTTGAALQGAWTHTDSTTAAGTVSNNYENLIGVVTDTTPTNAITITNEYEQFINAPVAGTHLTFTNSWALGLGAGLNVTAGNIGIASGQQIGNLTNTFCTYTGNTSIQCTVGTSSVFTIGNPDGVNIRNSGGFTWGPNAQVNGTADTGCFRVSADVINCGNGGSSDKTAAMEFRTFVASGSTPTLSGTCTTNTQTGGNTAGTFKATCTSQTVIITFAFTAPHGWFCKAQDNTTVADALNQTDGGASTTSCTLTGTTASADVITFMAVSF